MGWGVESSVGFYSVFILLSFSCLHSSRVMSKRTFSFASSLLFPLGLHKQAELGWTGLDRIVLDETPNKKRGTSFTVVLYCTHRITV
ncbi:hypothetical protein HDK64DRAFT_42657 [Phyllosticta capitalensis]